MDADSSSTLSERSGEPGTARNRRCVARRGDLAGGSGETIAPRRADHVERGRYHIFEQVPLEENFLLMVRSKDHGNRCVRAHMRAVVAYLLAEADPIDA